MGLPSLNTLNNLNPNFHGSILTPVELVRPDLEPFLGDISKDTKYRILKAIQEAHDENYSEMPPMSQMFTIRVSYSVSTELFNSKI